MAARQKKTIISGVTREAAEEAFANYAKANASIKKINALVELTCTKIREKNQAQLTQLAEEREKAFATLQAFATENKAELFTKKKSLDMAHGTIGFRTGTPKLKALKGFTLASAMELVKAFLPSRYIRVKEELDKDRILADRDIEAVAFMKADITEEVTMQEAMSRCGLLVAQDETFYVEPKQENTEE